MIRNRKKRTPVVVTGAAAVELGIRPPVPMADTSTQVP